MPRPKKNKNRADEATTGATGSATKPDREAGSSGFGTTFASASAAMAGPKADLFGDDDDDDNDGLGQEVELKVNDKFAARLEHNKKREELQRLEAKYGTKKALDSDDDSDYDSEEDVTEDEVGEQVTADVDEGINSILSAIRKKDPRIYETEQQWYKSQSGGDDDAGAVETKKEKKEKPMTLKEYHVRNLLDGGVGQDDDDDDGGDKPVGQSYQAEVDAARRDFLAAAVDAGSDSGDDLLSEKKRHKADKKAKAAAAAAAAAKKLTEEDIARADENPEKFLDTYFSTQAWIGERDGDEDDDPAWAALESDSDSDERMADTFEEAYNLRFEDPDKASEMLRTHSRTVAAMASVRRNDKLTKRQRVRLAEKERREAAEKEAKEERARLRKLRIEETERKVKVIKEAAGAKGREFDVRDWAKFLEGDYDDADWDKMMDKEFGDEYYGDRDDGELAKDEDIGAKKPTWDDDIDVGDLVGDVEADGADVQLDDGDDVNDVDMMDIDDDDEATTQTKKNKNLTKAEKAARKAAARAERRHVEAIVDAGLATDHIFPSAGDSDADDDSSKHKSLTAAAAAVSTKSGPLPSKRAGLGGFKYRPTDAQSFGLTPLDILVASDEQLNQFSGLKRYAPFRDQKKKEKDKKVMNSKRVKGWREDVFGTKEMLGEDVFAKVLEGKVEVGEVVRWKEMLAKREAKSKKRKRSSGDGKGEKMAEKKAEKAVEREDGDDDAADGDVPTGEGEKKKRRRKKNKTGGEA